jgi:methyl-accepting chemotaxis protein
MKIGLKGKLLIPALSLVLAGTLATAYLSFFNSRNMLDKLLTKQLEQIASTTLEYTTSWVENRRQDVILWSSNSNIRLCLVMAERRGGGESGQSSAMDDVQDLLINYNQMHPYYEEIALANIKGYVITSSKNKVSDKEKFLREIKNIKDTNIFRAAIKGNVTTTSVKLDKKTNNPVFTIAAPVKSMDSRIIGIFYAVVDLSSFSKKFIDPIKIGEKGGVYVFDNSGMIIAHPDKEMIMKVNVEDKSLGNKIRTKKQGILQYVYNGAKMRAGFKKDSTLGWTVVSVASIDELHAPVWQLARTNLAITVFIVILCAAVIFMLARKVISPVNEITSSLNRIAQNVSESSNQTSVSSQQLADGASTQASYIEEISASLEELAITAMHNADNAHESISLSSEVYKTTAAGLDSMDSFTQAMAEINQSNREVAQVAKAIEEIAFQTNLLALSAAVEAARSGAAGKGFKVVSEEIRNLAQRASEQARSASRLIVESKNKTEYGNKQAEETNLVLKAILDCSEKVSELINTISIDGKEQSQSISQISTSVSGMDTIVQKNSASSEEFASASRSLFSQAIKMKSLVNSLLDMVTSGQEDLKGFQENSSSPTEEG